jgi:CoA-substrate-specific enzyme activase, putative
MKTIGICFGATTIQAIKLQCDPQFKSVEKMLRIPHEGNPRSAFIKLLDDIDTFDVERIAVTGRSFRGSVALTGLPEPQAIECALKEEYAGRAMPDIVISAGGETQLVYKIGKDGGIVSVHSGNKCASGTGEFFLQQVRRMGLSLTEAVEMALKGTPHKIAGRCSVFCKSDCTHALNKGESRKNIAAGLCVMMADKICELIKDIRCERVAIIGGGCLNSAMLRILKARFDVLDVPANAAAFEAFGAALWASENRCAALPASIGDVFTAARRVFDLHPALKASEHLVEFRDQVKGELHAGDECILGLDVGSTTTKAVLMKKADRTIGASIYLRTNGDPIEASKQCYKALRERTGGIAMKITGLGVTGSGRQIAALHALTESVINEIIAHATAAAYFDREVDTIFEIGGQDAKYTFLTAGLPSDYAMNEACSAGTGSFLEESAFESLGVKMEEIGELAMAGGAPPNFTDQCSAFISSDVKQASQQGIDKNDVLAGLVYSVCLNYMNRVKGSRPVGKKIFMQGGVCYNRAVPIAMATLMKTRIIVPPDPGLMGAYGVALEVAKRLDAGLIKPAHFDLDRLIDRRAERTGSFICAGGTEKCDRKCEISRIKIDGKLFPFGGVCNKYYNIRFNQEVDAAAYDLVVLRQKLLFETFGISDPLPDADEDDPRKTVGILLSFLTYSLFPLYSRFFHKLGFRVILSDAIDREGLSRREASFCLPAEISHGSFYNLLKKNLDYIFLPQVMQVPVANVPTYSRTCVFVQGEPYYLPVTFRREIELGTTAILSPVLKMDRGYEAAEYAFVEMAAAIGVTAPRAKRAFLYACEKQKEFELELQEQGRKFLRRLDAHPEAFGIVLFGRPYNAFAGEANMGIAHKVASRGFMIVPHDMLPAEAYGVNHKMFWAMGQKIMKAAQYVKQRNNLFGFYITNFSCGPDAFLLGYFRNLMKSKPSLTLELDQHTADAGLDTRIEAALDIMTGYCVMGSFSDPAGGAYSPARVEYGKTVTVVASDGSRYSLFDKNVEVVLPSMGRYSTEGIAAVMRGIGIRAKALHIADKDVLLEGRKNASCKECLPYMVTTGSFLTYLKHRRDPHVVTLLFMPTGGGPCRLGQYCVALEQVLHLHRLGNVAVFTLTDENGYAGLGSRPLLKSWQAIIMSDVFCDIRSLLSVAAVDRAGALVELESMWKEVLAYFEGRFSTRFSTMLSIIARRLARIKLTTAPQSVPVVSLVGEIFVRRDEFSRKNIVDYLEGHGFAVKVAPIAEYMCYSNYVVNSGLGEREFTLGEQLKMKLTAQVQQWWERRIKSILAGSGLYRFEMIDVEKTIEGIRHLVNVNFRGEAILTIGLGMREILHDSCGVISIGPFGCMPSRVSEAILKKEMNANGKARMFGNTGTVEKAFSGTGTFPFLAIETDGTPFPMIVEANLEAFIVQARRLHNKMAHAASHPQTFLVPELKPPQ